MHPFSKGMVAPTGFYCTPKLSDLAIQKAGFYNPCFGLMGDRDFVSNIEKSPATHYYSRANLKWALFDQVIFRAELADVFDFKSLKIITEVNNTKLADEEGKPNATRFSDHFPIQFSLNLNHENQL